MESVGWYCIKQESRWTQPSSENDTNIKASERRKCYCEALGCIFSIGELMTNVQEQLLTSNREANASHCTKLSQEIVET